MSHFHILSDSHIEHVLSLFSLSLPTDPHIKVCGKRENVREAKDRIMSVLDTKVQYASLLL